VNFFPPIESVSRRQSVDACVSVVNARQIVNYCKMTERLEQRHCIKFCQKLGNTQVETIRKIHQSFGDDAMSSTGIKEWHNRFKDGSTSVDSEPRHGRPSTSRNDNVINQVRTLLMQDRRITFHKAKPTPKSTTRGYFVAFVMLCGANDRTCGQQKLGSSITTMHPPILRI